MKNGYSLVEIMIVISVMAVIFSAGTISYRDFTRRQQVVSAARQVTSDLRLAQQEALSARKPSAPLSPVCTGTLSQYNFRFDPTSQVPGLPRYTRYLVEAVCTNPNTTTLMRTATLPSFTTMDSFSTISFRPLGLGTTMVTGSSTTIIFRGTGTGYTHSVVVTSSGEVR